MIFYISILIILILCSLGKYSKLKAFMAFLILFLLISLKGEVGPDYYGYLVRYENFDPIDSLLKANIEFSWYLIEYITNVNQWSYQMYTFFTAIIGVGFLVLSQNKIKYIGFLVFIFQILIVQLGLSGVRQFIAACIYVYAVTIYLFENQKSIIKFILLIIFAASFHVSALAMTFVLPFLMKLNKKQYFLIFVIAIVGVYSEVFKSDFDKYDVRYLQSARLSAGAWIRFAITAIIIIFGLIKSNRRIYNLGLSILVFGLILGVVNTIALHRFNYYLLPIASLILIRNYQLSMIRHKKIKYVYVISILYLLFWFNLSKYADSYIPYTFFFN
jgi:hypothetical protein